MKLKKLLSVVVASAVAFAFMCGTAVVASAAPTFSDFNTVFRKVYGSNLGEYITTSFGNASDKITCTVKLEDGALPTIIDYEDLKALGNHNGDLSLVVKITDPTTNAEYTATIKSSEVKANDAALKSAGKVNLAIMFEGNPSKFSLYIYGYNGTNIGLPIHYTVNQSSWKPLLTQSGVPIDAKFLDYFSIDTGIKKDTIAGNADGAFIIDDDCRSGVYFEEQNPDSEWITKKEAVAYAKAFLLEQLGLTNKQIDDSNFPNLKEFFDDALAAVKKEITDSYHIFPFLIQSVKGAE